METRFIADVHLVKLANMLRLLGIDTAYKNNYNNQQLEQVAIKEERILLTRKQAFTNNALLRSYIILSEDYLEQLKSVIQHFNLKGNIKPFTRCLVCNGILNEISKSKIIENLEHRTLQFYNEFWQCEKCNKIYWKGSHYKRMQEVIFLIMNN